MFVFTILWSPTGKGLTYWLSCVWCLFVFLLLSNMVSPIQCVTWLYWFLNFAFFFTYLNEPVHEISNNVVCATSKASDQAAHTHSLIRAFGGCLSILWLLSYWLKPFGVSKPKRRLQRLVRVYTCQNAILLEISCTGSLMYYFVIWLSKYIQSINLESCFQDSWVLWLTHVLTFLTIHWIHSTNRHCCITNLLAKLVNTIAHWTNTLLIHVVAIWLTSEH